MYELHQVSETCYYIQSPAKIGLIKLDASNVCLIDSGNDKEAGRKVRQLLDANKWTLTAIYNTHAHADHIGGNKYLQGKTGCHIFMPDMECGLAQHPMIEPAFFYGGYPPKELQHKFLLAQASGVQVLTKESLPNGLGLVPLPGHFFQMTGYRTQEQIVYLADCVSSQATLEKYQIGFVYDVASYIQTLEMLMTLEANLFIPAHAEPTTDIAPLAQLNLSKVYEIADRIRHICNEPMNFERILQKLFQAYGLNMNFEQYVLVGSTIRSYLAWLKDTAQVDVIFEDSQLLWHRQ